MSSSSPGEFESDIRLMPKVELHRHLSGAIRLLTLVDLAGEHGVTLPTKDPASLAALMHGRATRGNLKDFLKTWRIINQVTAHAALRHPGIYERLVYEAIADAFRQENIRYLELRLVPPCLTVNHDFHAAEFYRALRAIKYGIDKASARFPTLTKIILSLPRDYLRKQTAKFLYGYYDILLKGAARYRTKYIVGFDLAGDELGSPPTLFVDFFQQAKSLGYKVTIHAGEADGPERVSEAVKLLNADRIGHGVSIVRDKSVIALLRERRIPMEICVTSNLATGAVEPFEQHPVRQLFDSGLFLTICADDPTLLSTNLNEEFMVLAARFGFTMDEIQSLTGNAVEAAFCTESEKARLRTFFCRRLATPLPYKSVYTSVGEPN